MDGVVGGARDDGNPDVVQRGEHVHLPPAPRLRLLHGVSSVASKTSHAIFVSRHTFGAVAVETPFINAFHVC